MLLRFGEIELLNFKSFKGKHAFSFDRPPGLYYVSGQNEANPALGANGVGKSTLFVDAPLWCLTGKITRSERPGGGVVTWGNDKAFSRVALKIFVDDVEHVIERTRNPNSLLLNGKDVEQVLIDQLLNMNESQLRRTVFVPQFGDLFLDLRPEAQSQMFTDILHLDIWLRSAKLAVERSSELDSDVSVLNSQIDTNRNLLSQIDEQLIKANRDHGGFEERIEDEIAATESEMNVVRDDLDQLDASAIPIDIDVRPLEQAIAHSNDDLNECQSKKDKISAEIAESRKTIKDKEDAIRGYDASPDHCPECGSIVSESHVRQKRDELLRFLDEEKSKLVRCNGQLSDVVAQIESFRERIAEQKAALRDGLIKLDLARSVSEERLRNRVRLEAREERLIIDLEKLKISNNPYHSQITDLVLRKERIEKETVLKQDEMVKKLEMARSHLYWSNAFKEIRLSIVDGALDELEVAANGVAQAMSLEGWEIRFETERETKAKTIQNKFSADIYPPSSKHPIPYQSYCGGEVQRWQMAVTFGLSSVLLARAGIDVAMECLDEPTAHLSEEGIEDLLAYLSERARSLKRAIYLVDHRVLDKGSFDGEVKLIKTSEGSKIA